MKKIMFNDKYGLTVAVLNRKKTQTRRVINVPDGCDIKVLDMPDGDKVSVFVNPSNGKHGTIDGVPVFGFVKVLEPKYFIDEVVAVAQSYNSTWHHTGYMTVEDSRRIPGYRNKMFVKADQMPHHIRITNIRIERLQDISDEDCLKEGISQIPIVRDYTYDINKVMESSRFTAYETPRDAYAALIDKVSGKGTWDENPYVFVYEFEKVD